MSLLGYVVCRLVIIIITSCAYPPCGYIYNSCYYRVYELSKLCNSLSISICDIYIAWYIVWQHMSTQFSSSLWKRKCIEVHFLLMYTLHAGIHQTLKISACSLQGTQINTVGLAQVNGQRPTTADTSWWKQMASSIQLVTCIPIWKHIHSPCGHVKYTEHYINVVATYVHNIKIKIHVLIWHLHIHVGVTICIHHVGMTNYTLQYLINIEG